jgi:mannose-6-phosphate isomerase-like protein (cupin superfamily)
MGTPKDHSPPYRKNVPIPYEGKGPLTQEEAEARLHREGYETFCWYDVPGAHYPKHRHEYDECLWVLRGELDLTIGEETLALRTGDRVYLAARTAHIARVPEGMEGVTYLVGQKKPVGK